MGKVIMSGIVPLLTVPGYPENFADATWAEIIEACQKKRVPDTWAVGSQKTMAINGTDYAIDIIGKNHDTYSDGSGAAPLTFQLHDCYGAGKYTMNSKDSNSGGWAKTVMRSTHLPAILALMPSEAQSAIREVDKLTCADSASTTVSTTADKLFLLSEIEILGSHTLTYGDEGTQYDYYKAGNPAWKKISGSYDEWWMRTLYSSKYFCIVNASGAAKTDYSSNTNGVSFAFCF